MKITLIWVSLIACAALLPGCKGLYAGGDVGRAALNRQADGAGPGVNTPAGPQGDDKGRRLDTWQ